MGTWGDKMTKAEIDDIFGEFEIDEDYMIKTKDIVGLFVAVKEEPKVEEVAVVEEAAPEEEEEDADAKKKKKKKKKAAKKITYLNIYFQDRAVPSAVLKLQNSTFQTMS